MPQIPLSIAPPLLDDPAENFHRASRLARLPGPSHFGPYTRTFLDDSDTRFDFGVPTLFPPDSDGYDLPGADHAADRDSLVGAMRARRSENAFDPDAALPGDALAAILSESAAISDVFGRSAPSAGGLYPLDCFAVVVNVDGFAPGFYGFHPFRNRLGRLAISAEPRAWLEGALAYRTLARTCGAVVFTSAAFDRLRIKYGQRGYRFALLEAGHLAQSMLLVAASRGVSACALGGYFDDDVDRTLGLDGIDISVVHGVAFGMPFRGEATDD